MKVLHINYSDTGGAFIAMRRLDLALKAKIGKEYSSDFLIVSPSDGYNLNYVKLTKNPFWKAIRFLRPRLVRLFFGLFFKHSAFKTYSYNILPSNFVVNYINKSSYDIIHFHWIGGETISISDFRRIRKRVVWTLHDVWACYGREHLPTEGKQLLNPIDKWIVKKKKKHWKGLRIDLVCVSSWLKQELVSSGNMEGNNISIIGNAIDVDSWKPIEQNLARSLFNLNSNKIYLTLGAVNPMSDPNKGYLSMINAIQQLPQYIKDNIEILMYGIAGDGIEISGVKITPMGKIYDEITLKLLFAASDVVIVPSFYESFGQTALEGIAMGKPVVCFDSSGTTDIIDHLKTGYLAKSFDNTDFANGIVWCIENRAQPEVIKNCIDKAKRFASLTIAEQYYKIYLK